MTKLITVYSVVVTDVARRSAALPPVMVLPTEAAARSAFNGALRELKAAHPEAVETYSMAAGPVRSSMAASLLVPCGESINDWRAVAGVVMRSHGVALPEGFGAEAPEGPSVPGTVGTMEEA